MILKVMEKYRIRISFKLFFFLRNIRKLKENVF